MDDEEPVVPEQKTLRFLPKLEVRIKESATMLTLAGSEGVIINVISPEFCLVQVRISLLLAPLVRKLSTNNKNELIL